MLADRLGVEVTTIPKLAEGDRAILDLIRSGQCAAVINTPTQGRTVDRDGFLIRRAAVEARVPCLTSMDTALAVVTALRASARTFDVAPLAEYRAGVAAATPDVVASAD
jgi:carbamoyl-phosphate synthase large subunit